MTRDQIEELFYGKRDQEMRFTQDFPILPDVWIKFGGLKESEGLKEGKNRNPQDPWRVSLLLTPHYQSDAIKVAKSLRQRRDAEVEKNNLKRLNSQLGITGDARILFNESVVLADFSFWEMVRIAMPLTSWWQKKIAPLRIDSSVEGLRNFARKLNVNKSAVGAQKSRKGKPSGLQNRDLTLLKKLINIASAIDCELSGAPESFESVLADNLSDRQIESFARMFQQLPQFLDKDPEDSQESIGDGGVIWSISLNRPAMRSVFRSRLTVKADAATRLFQSDTHGIRWAVLDTGIDARHPAFVKPLQPVAPEKRARKTQKAPIQTRIVKTYDFLRVKILLDPDAHNDKKSKELEKIISSSGAHGDEDLENLRAELRRSLQFGRAVDWDLLEPFLRVPVEKEAQYREYVDEIESHGTHVAGIIGADWKTAPRDTGGSIEEEMQGMCPDIELYDLRVLGPGADEFTIIAALQFVRHINAHKDVMVIHGVNLSLSVPHDVANYACGRTPICQECERLVASGVVVVTAAGNRGFNKFADPDAGALGDYRYISITDPGNAEAVITVGATHRLMPHTYGVSYFSSRGPTGDGRRKPDLVAPGERITSCTPGNNFDTMDGTSMAAPHVSGAAALLISRHQELIGQPDKVKEILMKSATDLGREPRFQGAGNLDVLRAMQSM